MDEKEILNQIPLDWYDQLDMQEVKSEQEISFNYAVKSLIETTSLEKENPSFDDILEAGVKRFNLSKNEIHGNLIDFAMNDASIKLFLRHYGHLLPKDEKGSLLFSPKIMSIVSGRSEEEILRDIEKHGQELGDFKPWPDQVSDLEN